MGKSISSSNQTVEEKTRPLVGVLLVVASFLPEKYDTESYKVLRDSYYKSPEIYADSWNRLLRLIELYLKNEGMAGDKPEDYPENVQLMGNIFADRVDYRKYLKIENLPPMINRDIFLQLVKENREWLGF